ncbi:MAG: hypothetical protein KDI36_11790, partial [Pseudomonadales bacterium]|nr:hypothetical protein [Pseudomonadales bacterium]
MTKFTEAKSAGVTFTGRIRKDTGSGVVLELNSAACDGCRSCTSDRLVQVPLPEDDYAHNAQIVLSLGYRKQWQLAFNSLILPILCLITGAALAEVFSG